MAVEMELVSVEAPELPSRTPVVILRERSGRRRVLPIFIGTPEAQAIALAMQQIETPRPMTHDLMRSVLDEAGRAEASDSEDAEQMVEQFRDFIDQVNPEDFAQ